MSRLGFKKDEPPEWVQQQHKTMLKWVNSKLDTNLTDLSKDMSDGLILIQLINKIITEIDIERTDLKLYLLKPLYKNPKIGLQKMENVNDFLEFIRIVLKINTTSISADNIIEGNLKLILGLIWTLFIFSTSNSIGILNEGNSIIQIKDILMNWVNKHSKLNQISNFNRDWSIEINSPDKILKDILKSYIPIDFLKLDDSKLSNLKTILQFAEKLGIPRLAEIEDFQNLVPDEKCILFYLIEWFKFFELSNNFETIMKNDERRNNECNEELEYFDKTLLKINDILKSKFEYETKSLRFSNKLISINSKYENLVKQINETNVFTLLNNCDKVSQDLDSEEFKISLSFLKDELKCLSGKIDQFEELNNTINRLKVQDFKDLEHLDSAVHLNLKLFDEAFEFKISKNLILSNLLERFNQTLDNQELYHKKMDVFSKRFFESQFNERMEAYYKSLPEDSELMPSVNKVTTYLKDFRISKSNNIKISVGEQSAEGESLYPSYCSFKRNLLKFDDKLITDDNEFRTILEDMTTINLSSKHLKMFMDFVPVKFVTISPNDSDFSLLFDDDDDDSIDNSKLIFEGNRKKVGSQLSGNKDKVYDLQLFFIKFENGLKI